MAKLHQFDAFVIFLDCTTCNAVPFPCNISHERFLISQSRYALFFLLSWEKDAVRNRIHLSLKHSLKRITIIIEPINVLITFILCKKRSSVNFILVLPEINYTNTFISLKDYCIYIGLNEKWVKSTSINLC